MKLEKEFQKQMKILEDVAKKQYDEQHTLKSFLEKKGFKYTKNTNEDGSGSSSAEAADNWLKATPSGKVDEAKRLFFAYRGNHYFMARNDDGKNNYEKYKSYNVPKAVENEWRLEKVAEYKDRINCCSNNKELTYFCFRLEDYYGNISEKECAEYLLNLIRERKESLDSLSLIRILRCVLNLTNHINGFADFKKEKYSECVDILIEEQKAGLKISYDYKENGVYPDYASMEKLSDDYERTVKYYLDVINQY